MAIDPDIMKEIVDDIGPATSEAHYNLLMALAAAKTMLRDEEEERSHSNLA